MEAVLAMLREAEKAEKVSKKKIGWWDLPYEMREMIINKMDNATKLAFCLCSDHCAADMPKSYVKSIEILDSAFHLGMAQDKSMFWLVFSASSNKKCTIKCIGDCKDLWEMVEGKKQVDVVARYFQRIIANIHEMKHISFQSSFFPFKNTTIRHLKKLEKITIDRVHPIDFLEIRFMHPEQLLRVRKSFKFIGMPLTLPQLRFLNSENMNFYDTIVSSEDINQFLKWFQNGKIHENFGIMHLSIRYGYQLNHAKVIEGLCVLGKVDYQPTRFVIIDTINSYRVAEIELARDTFNMKVTSKSSYYENDLWKVDQHHNVIDEYFKSLT